MHVQVDHIDKRTGHVFCMFPGMKGRHLVPGLCNMKLTGNDWDGEFQLRRVVWYHYQVRHCGLDRNGASLCAHIFDDIKLHVRERDLCVICHRLVEFK